MHLLSHPYPFVRKVSFRDNVWSVRKRHWYYLNDYTFSNVGIVNGLNATEMREIFDAMRHDALVGATVAETLERLKGVNMTDEDKENSRLRDQVKSDVESARGNRQTFEEFMRGRRGERGSLNAQVTDVEVEDDQEIVD